MLKKVIDNSIIIVYYILVVRKELEMMSLNEIQEAEDYLGMFNAEEMKGALNIAFYIEGYTEEALNDVCRYYYGMDYDQLAEEMGW